MILYLIPLFIHFIINYFVAKAFESIAFDKGYDESVHSFAWCFWLGIIGYLYVIALPDKRARMCSCNNEEQVNPKAKEQPVLEVSKERYECTQCTVTGRQTDGNCMMCRRHQNNLKYCKIKNIVGTRDIPICDECIKRFKENCKE